MKHFRQTTKKVVLWCFVLSFILAIPGFLSAEENKVVDKTFKAKELIEIKTVSGDVVIKKGNDNEIKVNVVYTFPPDKFEPIFTEESNTLVLVEKFSDNLGHGVKGKSKWTLLIPANTKINFSTASGDLQADGIKNNIQVKAASGDIELTNFQGELFVKNASGDVKAVNSNGKFQIKSASGDVSFSNVSGKLEIANVSGDLTLKNVEFKEAASISTVSGDMEIQLGKPLTVDLELSAISGDILLDYNGTPIKGHFEFKGNVENFSAPFRTKKAEEDNDEHIKIPFGNISHSENGDTPRISIKSISGEAKIKK